MAQSPSIESSIQGAPPESFGFRRILYTKNGYVSTITINRPEVLNCFDYTTLKELATAFLDSSVDDQIAVVVITGTGDRLGNVEFICARADVIVGGTTFSEAGVTCTGDGVMFVALLKSLI